MKLPPFLLDEWLSRYKFARPPVEYDLASSTGPVWTLRELVGLAEEREPLFDEAVVYAPAEGRESLRRALAEMAGVGPEEVLVVTGASEALWILFFLAAGPGASVVVPFPGYPVFGELPRALGIELRCYRLRPENSFRADPDEIRRLTDSSTRLILINSPHNPTGSVVGEEAMRQIHDLAAEREIPLVADEVYHPVYQDRELPSAAQLARVTVLGDFSKAFCLSGLRLGWMVERDRRRREAYVNARSYFTISNSPVSEALAEIAVRHRQRIWGRAREATRTNLKLADSFFAARQEKLGWVRPAGGMTAFPWLRNRTDSRDFCRAAAERGVLLVPGDCFGMPAHFRLGFGASGDRFPRALERLADFVDRS